MQDFFCAEAQKMNYSVLANRVKYFKEDKEGVHDMCRIMEELREETRRETRRETQRKDKIEFAKKMLKDGSNPFEKISEFSGLSIEEVEKLASKIDKKTKS